MLLLKIIRPIFFFSGILLALAGCGFEAPAPKRTPPPPTPEPPLSSLFATLTVPADRLASLLNNTTEYRIAELHDQPVNCGVGRCRLNLTANRTGPGSVTADAGALNIKMPFSVKAELSTSGLFSFLHAQGDGQGTAFARSALAISPDLRLRTSTTGSVMLESGHLRLGPVVTNIAKLWNDNQASLANPLWHSIDKRVSALPLQSRVAALWAKLFVPLRIGKSPVAWLVLRPEQLSVSPPHIGEGAVGISLGIVVRGHVVVQDQQPVNQPTPLPRARPMTSKSDAFSFAVPLLLSYDRAAQLAMASLSRKPPQIATMAIHFQQLRILPSGQDVVVAARFCADPHWDRFGWFASCGMIYLRGTPTFDRARQAIRISNLHYDIASAGLLLKTLHVLAGSALMQELQPHLVFDEKKEIGRLKSQIISVLAKPEGQDISISAHVQNFGEPSFTWTEDGFLAEFSAQGTVKPVVNF
jgi:hypothetical protein